VSPVDPSVYCQRCGAPLPAGEQFCSKCGAAVPVSRETPGEPPVLAIPPEKGGTSKWVFVLIGCLVLLFAIPVILIVAAIVIPNFSRAREQAQLAQDEVNMRNIATALETYGVDNGRYPATLRELVPKYLPPPLPAVPGTKAAYVYHHPSADKRLGSYDIEDDGSLGRSMLGRLPNGPGGAPCGEECKYVVYGQSAGLIGKP